MILPFLYKRLSWGIFLLRAMMSPSLVGTGAVVESGGRVLLVRHSYVAGWRLSGGGVDRGEAPDHAVMRELKEEIGLLSADPPRFLGVATRRVGVVTNQTLMYFVGGAEYAFTPGLEIREVRLCDPDALPEDTTHGTQNWINTALKQGCFRRRP